MGTLSHKGLCPGAAHGAAWPWRAQQERREFDARELAIAYPPHADSDAKATPQHSSRRGKPSLYQLMLKASSVFTRTQTSRVAALHGGGCCPPS